MRLDKWLKVSRLIKRRTVANEACDNARVMANGRPVKASYDVKEGDVLELRFGERTVKVEVLVVAEHMGKTEAAAMYREILWRNKKARYPQKQGRRAFVIQLCSRMLDISWAMFRTWSPMRSKSVSSSE